MLFGVALSFILASISYAFVEQPFRNNVDLVNRPSRGLALGFGLIAISIVSAVLAMNLTTVPEAAGAPTNTSGSIARQVVVGTRLHALPLGLSPPLEAVPTDSPYTCLSDLTARSPSRKDTCVLGDTTSSHTVVLFGDSKAWQWTTALAAVAREHGWKLVTFTKGDCPAEDVVTASEPSSHCAQWRNAVFTRLEKLRPAVVIISSYTREFVAQFPVTPDALSVTIARLKADGSSVVWLEDTPYPAIDVPDCLSEHPTAIQQCGFTLASGLSTPTVRAALDQQATRAGAFVIDPVPWLCTAEDCPPVISNTVVYFDATHISSAYARKLEPELSASLATVLPRIIHRG
jgi:hypothetical protein